MWYKCICSNMPLSSCNLWSGMRPATDAFAIVSVLSFRNTMAINGYFTCVLWLLAEYYGY